MCECAVPKGVTVWAAADGIPVFVMAFPIVMVTPRLFQWLIW